MKNANSNINTIHQGVFIPVAPELISEFKSFVVMVNEYPCLLRDDIRYHPSRTRGQAGHRNVTICNGRWKFFGTLSRENQPYTDTAEFYYCGRKVWEMKRTITFLPSDSRFREEGIMDKVQFCILGAAKNYNQDIPWCGPRYYNDSTSGLHYEARYREGDDDFSIEESISDYENNVVWAAVCKGGYT